MKKAYISPNMELVLFESTEAIMGDGDVEYSNPDDPFAGINFDQWINDLPNGYIIDDSELENFKQ